MCSACCGTVSPLRRRLLAAASAGLLAPLVGCSANTHTGRDQLILIDDAKLAAMSADAWASAKTEQTISQDPAQNAMVERVMRRLTAVNPQATSFEYAVFEDDKPNAWVLPGGKVGVNSGMFRIATSDDMLAAVLGHEQAHVVARHSAERVSQGLAAQVGQSVLGAVVGARYGGNSAKLAQQAFGIGARYGVLMPYGRQQELEADSLGLKLMTQAGYNPHAAITLWQNMSAESRRRPPEFLSTHPSPDTRITALQQQIAAMGY